MSTRLEHLWGRGGLRRYRTLLALGPSRAGAPSWLLFALAFAAGTVLLLKLLPLGSRVSRVGIGALGLDRSRWTPPSSTHKSSEEVWDLLLSTPLPTCQSAAIPWASAEYLDVESKLAQQHGSLMSLPRLRATLELTLAVLGLAPGADIVETGVYKGGCAGMMLRALAAHDGCARRLWVFDSFDGLPEPDPVLDLGDAPFFAGVHPHFAVGGALRSGLGDFMATLRDMGAPSDASRLVVSRGYFNATVRASPVEKIGLLHLDGDYFASTWEALEGFYDKVVPGGYVYIDDYHTFRGCAEAVDTFRWQRGISEPLRWIRETKGLWEATPSIAEAVFWRKRPY